MKKHLLKTLLVATGLLAGSVNSWGDVETTTTKFDFEDNKTVFKEDSRITVAIENDQILNSKVVTFTNAQNAQNNYSFAHYDFSSLIEKAQKITISFDYWNTKGGRNYMTIGDAATRGNTGNSTKITYSKKGAIFRIGSDRNNFYINDEKLDLNDYADKWLNVSVTVDPTNQKVSYSIKDANDKELKAENNIGYYDNSVATCSQIDAFGYINNSKMAKIDNLTIAVDRDKAAAFADYKIAFKDESGSTLKEEATGNGQVGTVAFIGDNLTSSFLNEDKSVKYIYSKNDAVDNKIKEDGSTIITLTFRKAETWNYNVYASYGGNTEKIAEGTSFEQDNVSYAYPKYKVKDGILYESTKGNANTGYYLGYATLDEDNKTFTVDYKATGINNVVYYSEAEDVKGLTATSEANATFRCSNGTGAYNANEESVILCTLPAGKYKLKATVWGNAGENILVNYGEIWEMPTKGYLQDYEKEIILSKSTDITIPKCGASSKMLDYLYIQKLGEVANVTAAKYATYVTSGAVKVPANAKVMTAKVENNKLVTTTLSAGTVIPANTAIIVNAEEAGDVSFEMASENGSIMDLANDLHASTGVTADGTQYCLTEQDGKVGFGKVKAGVVIPAGKAYLVVKEQASANFFAFDGTVTAIKNVETSATADGAYYTLQGVKVEKPTKGIYVHNGKKVIIK